MQLKRLPIRNKLILMIIAPSILTLFLAIATILYFNIQTIKQRAVQNIAVLGDVIAERSTAALAFMDNKQAERNLQALKNMKYIKLACLYLNDSIVLAEYNNTTNKNSTMVRCPTKVEDNLSTGIYTNNHLIWGEKIFLDDSNIGYIYIITDDSFVFEEFYQGITQYLMIIFVVFLLSFFIANWAQKFISQPIIKLEKTARKIAMHHDFSIRAEKSSNDELGDLIDTFNSMLDQTEQNEKTLLLQKELLESHQQHLETEVKQRTSKLQILNDELIATLQQVESMQNQLIESEKMASLGGLVAGIAHEVNTPIGICLTAASFLKERNDYLQNIYNKDEMTKHAFEDFLTTVDHSSEMILKNIQRATETIQNFKKVAVDQSAEDKRCFNLKDYFYEIIKSLHPKLKRHNHKIKILSDSELYIDSYPGAFYQIFSNLILNSVIHGFEYLENGNIIISITYKKNKLIIEYKDDGKGMSEDILNHVFEPFVTTKRNKGGTGLGAHIIYNIVTQQLQGTISCQSSIDAGVSFNIKMPVTLCQNLSTRNLP
ncbi:MAG: ATP-binding protein [Pseudomonadota bacterium]